MTLILSKISIIFALLKTILCFEANVAFSLKSTYKSSTAVNGVYNIHILKDSPFNIFDYILINMIESIDSKNFSLKQHNLIIEHNDQEFKITGDSYYGNFNNGKHLYLEFEFEDILNMIFKCRNHTNYVTRFIYLYKGIAAQPVNDRYSHCFTEKYYIFWIIMKKNSESYNNEINFTEYLDDCHKNAIYYIFLLFGLILLIIGMIFGIIHLQNFLMKHKIYPY